MIDWEVLGKGLAIALTLGAIVACIGFAVLAVAAAWEKWGPE